MATDMPRIDCRDTDDPAIAELADTIRRRRASGRLPNLDRTLLRGPPFARGWNAMFAAAIRNQLQVPRHVNELAIRAVTRLDDADDGWLQHAPEFIAAGGRPGQLDALDDVTAACCDATRFDEVERAALRLTLAMTREVRMRPEVVELVGTSADYRRAGARPTALHDVAWAAGRRAEPVVAQVASS